jgi:hypothetical protein
MGEALGLCEAPRAVRNRVEGRLVHLRRHRSDAAQRAGAAPILIFQLHHHMPEAYTRATGLGNRHSGSHARPWCGEVAAKLRRDPTA